MDASAVRRHAEAHAAANVEGDMSRAAGDLTSEARANIAPVARRLPRPITAAEVIVVEPEGADRVITQIRYSGPSDDAIVESVWVEIDGRPMIAEARIV
ncbi:MAG: hypothetical protein M3P18_20795 [Actinomycetota bacterium]|nr:hypothetical protein [Actinomycetota bacterium]